MGRTNAHIANTNKRNSITYKNISDGIRTQKRIFNNIASAYITHDYVLDGSTIVKETVRYSSALNGESTTTLEYYYDESGIASLRYNGTIYYYIKNLQGDVIGILDNSGEAVVEYTYDAWGNILSVTGSLASTVGQANPFRYRGYYYDTDTGLYYLNSRYYDPQVGRFINADGYVSTGQSILGNNIFVYCGNNPVNRVDPTGRFWSEVWEFAKTAVTEIGKAIGVLSPAYAGCGGAAVADGPLPIGDIIGAAGAALLTVGAIGYGIYQATQASSISIPKVEEKEKDITVPPPSPTVIYRYGGTNPGNLTPKAKDLRDGRGLSFSTVPGPGCSMTTIEALNATGIVYAV